MRLRRKQECSLARWRSVTPRIFIARFNGRIHRVFRIFIALLNERIHRAFESFNRVAFTRSNFGALSHGRCNRAERQWSAPGWSQRGRGETSDS